MPRDGRTSGAEANTLFAEVKAMARHDSTRKKTLEKWRRWKQRNRGFPLTPHPNGQWCKRIRGVIHYFGPLDDKEGSLNLWLEEKDDLLAGREPASRLEGYSLGELCDEHLADCEERVEVGKMARWSLKDFTLARRMIDAAGVANVPVEALKPHHFTKIQQAVERSGLRPRSQRNAILSTKTILNWGVEMQFCSMPSTGPRFKAPSLPEIEADQDKHGAMRFFDRDALLPAIHHADERMLVVILLGVNCAFYPQDSETITLDHLFLDHEIPHHEFRRVKTGRRRVAVLWPETVAAIRQYLAVRSPEDPAERRLLLNQWGRPYSQASAGKSLSRLFDTLLAKSSDKLAGASLGSLRHTCATVMGLATDQPMIDLVMGHVAGGSQGRKMNLHRRIYTQANLGELDRLEAIAEVVRQWLYYGRIGNTPDRRAAKRDESDVVSFRAVG